jgi:hypothetical protein
MQGTVGLNFVFEFDQRPTSCCSVKLSRWKRRWVSSTSRRFLFERNGGNHVRGPESVLLVPVWLCGVLSRPPPLWEVSFMAVTSSCFFQARLSLLLLDPRIVWEVSIYSVAIVDISILGSL